jgi:hypothetical protein
VNAYTLTFAVLLLTGAALGDRFGRRHLFVIGLGSAISQLRDVSFIGLEVADGWFDFADDVQLKRRADVMARRLARSRGAEVRSEVHSAFRPYLEIDDPVQP